MLVELFLGDELGLIFLGESVHSSEIRSTSREKTLRQDAHPVWR